MIGGTGAEIEPELESGGGERKKKVVEKANEGAIKTKQENQQGTLPLVQQS